LYAALIVWTLKALATSIEVLLRRGGRPKMERVSLLLSIVAMTPRPEINVFFEQGLYMMLFASNAGGL
jgi:hypothetical protein